MRPPLDAAQGWRVHPAGRGRPLVDLGLHLSVAMTDHAAWFSRRRADRVLESQEQVATRVALGSTIVVCDPS